MMLATALSVARRGTPVLSILPISALLLLATTASISAQPVMDGVFDGTEVWGEPIASNPTPGFEGFNSTNLYSTFDDNYVYVGAQGENLGTWKNFGFLLNVNPAIGGSTEPWARQIVFAHPQGLPEFAIRGEYNGEWAEYRLWNGSNWDTGAGVNVLADGHGGVSTGFVEFRIPLAGFGGATSFQVQFFVSGDNAAEHATFDAIPQDQVMTGWDHSGNPTTLQNYATASLVVGAGPVASFSPSVEQGLQVTVAPGQTVSGTVNIANTGDADLEFAFPAFANGGRSFANAANPLAHLGEAAFAPAAAKGFESADPEWLPARGSGGPDAFGYSWIDSDEPGGPAFEAIDIRETGQVVELLAYDTCTAGPPLDEGRALVELPFAFPYYGESHTSVYVSANGILNFLPYTVCTWSVGQLPGTAAPNATVAPLWADLEGKLATSAIHKELLPDGRFVIQFTDWTRFGEAQTAPNTFQAILSPGGDIKFQYVDIQATFTASTRIGIEDHAGAVGLLVASGAGYAATGKAVAIMAPAPDFVTGVSPAMGTVAPGTSVDVMVDFSAAGLDAGTYEASLTIDTNEPDRAVYDYPVTMVVEDEDPVGPVAHVDPEFLQFDLGPDEVESQSVALSNLAAPGADDLDFTVDVVPMVSRSRTLGDGRIDWLQHRGGAHTVSGQLSLDVASVSGAGGNVELRGGNGGVSMTHSNSMNVTHTVGVCGYGNPQVASAENSFWRVFDLAAHGVQTGLEITEILYGVGLNQADNEQTFFLYTVDGDFEWDNLTLIGAAAFTVETGDAVSVLSVEFGSPVFVPAGSHLAVRVHIPDSGGGDTGYRAHAGFNLAGQTAPTFWHSAQCGFPDPVPLTVVGAPPDLSWVLAVVGNEVTEPTPAPVVTVEPLAGSVAAGGSQELVVTVDTEGVEAAQRADFSYVVVISTNDPASPILTVDVDVSVSDDAPSHPIAHFLPTVEDGLAVTIESGQSTTATINIANAGTADLEFDFVEFSARGSAYLAGIPTETARPFAAPMGHDRASGVQVFDGAADAVVAPVLRGGPIPGDWTEGFADITLLPDAGWAMQNNSSPVGPTGWFQGNPATWPAHSGEPNHYIGANFNNTTGNNTISNWLLTPEVVLENGTQLSFWARSADSQWSDRLQVRLSTAGASTNVGSAATDVGDFTTLLLDINPDYASGVFLNQWVQYTVTVSGLEMPTSGRFAFRYFVESGGPSGANSDFIGIDDVGVMQPGEPGEDFVTGVSPAAGTVAPGNSVDVTVSLSAVGFVDGTYQTTLAIETNEPERASYAYPVTMVVEDAPDTITIAEARALGVGATVTVEGTVSRAMGAFTYFQDATAGLTIRQTAGAPLDFHANVADGTITTGTQLRVTGTISAFQGLLQFNEGDLASYEILGQGEGPAPQVVTFDDIDGDSHQAELVHVANAWFPTASGTFAAATTYQVTDASIQPATFEFRIPNAADTQVDGTPIPEDLFDFTGVVGHFAIPQLLAILETDIQPAAPDALTFDPPIQIGLEVTTNAGTTTEGTVTLTNTLDVELDFEFPQFAARYELANPANPLAHLMHRFPEVADRNQDFPFPAHIPTRGQGGPDDFGYTWIDSDEPGGPSFESIDISTTGTALVFETIPGITLPPRDEGIAEVTLPFAFSFYGETHTQLYVSPNGYVALQPVEGNTFTARPFPATNSPNATTPGAMIAPMWFDFDGSRPVADDVYAQHLADGRFVIQWNDWPRWNENNLNTIQLILYPSGAIKYQYLDINAAAPVFGGPQIGIQNHTGTDGLTVASGLGYAQAGKAVLISAVPPFVTDVSPASGTLAAGASVDVTVSFDATDLLDGTYTGSLTIETGEPDNGLYEYPVTLNVVGEPGCVIEPDPIAFGGVIVGFDATMSATVTNEGTADCELTGATIDEDDFSTDFEPVTLGPGGSATFDVTFAPSSVGSISGTLTLEAADGPDVTAALSGTGLAPPVASVEPDMVELTINQDQTTDTAVLSLSNLGVEGAADLEFSISLVAARPAPAALATGFDTPTARQAATAGRSASEVNREGGVEGGPFPQTDFGRGEGDELIQDGSFEAGTPNPFWDEASTNFGTPLCDQASCGFGGGTGPNTGQWWAWFGGIATANEIGHVAQMVEIPFGGAELSFYLEIPSATTSGWMRVSIDGDLLFEVTDTDAGAYGTYQQVILDVSQYADGGTHELKFEGSTQAGGTTNFFVDDVSLISTGPSFLTVDPMSGAVAAGSSADITLTAMWDENIELGSYSFELLIQTNDPDTPVLVVDVIVHVETIGTEGEGGPLEFALEANYPNPFSAQTTIAYSLAEPSAVRIAVYDVAGRRIATLVDTEMEAGRHTATWDANGVAAGVYFYRIQAGTFTRTLRALVVR